MPSGEYCRPLAPPAPSSSENLMISQAAFLWNGRVDMIVTTVILVSGSKEQLT